MAARSTHDLQKSHHTGHGGRLTPRDVLELKAYFAGDPALGIVATPGAGEEVAVKRAG